MTPHATSPKISPANHAVSVRRIYLIRAAVALVWAGLFASVSGSLGHGAMGLLIAYPIIDVIASIADSRHPARVGSRNLLAANAALSAAAVIGVAAASAVGTQAVLRVFGSWAIVSGVAQFAVALWRRPTLGRQWAMLLSGLISTIAGIGFVVSAASTNARLTNLSGYALLGSLFFIVSAVALTRRVRGQRVRPA